MRLVNLALVIGAVVVAAGGYFQERRRLARFRELPAARAQALFEAAERRRERTMLVVTVALTVAAVAALVLRVRR